MQAVVSLISRTPDLVSGREYADLWVEGQMHANIYNSLGISRVNLANELTKLYMDKDNYYTLDGKGYNFTQYQKMARQQFN